MSNPEERFLDRWSRLKQQEPEPKDIKDIPVTTVIPEAAPIDLTTLPSLESLTSESDYRPFLQAGIPETLKLQALRKLWASDPEIGAYQLMADYAWDFNAPGYGRLWASDDVVRLARELLEPTSAPEQNPVAEPTGETLAPNPAVSPNLMPITSPLPQPEVPPKSLASEDHLRPAPDGEISQRHGSARPKI